MKIVIESDVKDMDFWSEDLDMAMIAEVSSDDQGVFVRLQSFNENGKHESLQKLLSFKKIRITIEGIE